MNERAFRWFVLAAFAIVVVALAAILGEVRKLEPGGNDETPWIAMGLGLLIAILCGVQGARDLVREEG